MTHCSGSSGSVRLNSYNESFSVGLGPECFVKLAIGPENSAERGSYYVPASAFIIVDCLYLVA
ncbi:hypothetical protein D3C85_408820 [compost metagenome]